MDDALERNLAVARRLVVLPAALLAAVPAVVVLVALALTVPVLSPLAVVVQIALFFGFARMIRTRAPEVALAATASRPLAAADEPRLHNLVEGLCVGIGLEPPRLRVVEDDAPNALAVARSVDDADLVVTRGLLTRLSLVELEAVLAHELARIRRGEAVVGVLAGPSLGAVSAAPASLLAPVTRALVGQGEPVESWSDLAAVDITRYPPGLASALAALAQADPAVPPSAAPAVAHLWVHGARAEGAFGEALARVYEITPPAGPRIEVLEEL